MAILADHKTILELREKIWIKKVLTSLIGHKHLNYATRKYVKYM